MSGKDKGGIFEQAYKAIGDRTPLKGHDCGQLCERACCAGSADSGTGMLLFPGESTSLEIIENENGRFAVCGGTCDRAQRPLACRIFPFYPAIDDDGEVTAIIDGRGSRLCPLVRLCDDVIFDEKFVSAVEKAGAILARDADCAAAMREATGEIIAVNTLLFGDDDDDGEDDYDVDDDDVDVDG